MVTKQLLLHALLHTMNKADVDYIACAIEAIKTEQTALSLLIEQIDERFVRACQLFEHCQGRVVVTGMGKSGLIGRKIAATLASTGTPAFFMHPGEAGHGDLGMLVKGDVLLAISNSGESNEIKMLLPVVKTLNIPLVSISRDARGALPRAANVALTLGQFNEACPLGLAPTSSTTATLALGDAIAVALLHARDFTSSDFAMSHPAGALGRKLLTRVQDVMHQTSESLPIVAHHDSLNNALLVMTSGRLGMTAIVNDNKEVVGIFTDGDLRRALAKGVDLQTPMTTVMTANPLTVDESLLASDALTLMNEKAISQLMILDNQHQLKGIISLHDLLQAGIS